MRCFARHCLVVGYDRLKSFFGGFMEKFNLISKIEQIYSKGGQHHKIPERGRK